MVRSGRQATARPLLLPLVYVATLTLIGVSSAALAVLGAEHVRTTAIRTAVAGDEAAITEFVATELTTADLGSTPLDTERRANLDTSLARLANTHGYRVITLSRLDGSVIASAAGAQDAGDGAAMHQRVSGAQSTVDLSAAADGQPILVETFPVTADGAVRMVVGIDRDARFVVSAVDEAWRDVVIVTGLPRSSSPSSCARSSRPRTHGCDDRPKSSSKAGDATR